MRTLKDVLGAIESTKVVAQTSLDEVPLGNRPGWTMRIEAAKSELEMLRAEYGHMLGEVTTKVFLVGSPAEVAEFCKLAGELDVNGIVVDASTIYRRLADRAARTLGARGEFAWTQLRNVNAELYELAVMELGTTYREIVLEELPPILRFDDLLTEVRRMVRAENGDSINSLFLNRRITDLAIRAEIDGPAILFIRGATEQELPGLSADLIGQQTRVVHVDVPTLESVRAALSGSELYNTQSEDLPNDTSKKRGAKKKENINVP